MPHFIMMGVVCFLSSKPGPVGYTYWNQLRQETSVWGSSPGQVPRHRQPVTTLVVSVPLLENRRPNLNLRGLSSPVPIHGFKTCCRPLPPTSSAPSATCPDIIYRAIIEHRLCARLHVNTGNSAVMETGMTPALVQPTEEWKDR